MHNTVISKAAAHFSSYQLAEILSHCFEGYLVPFTIDGKAFASRFAAEDMSLNDSRVWMQNDEPKALAIISRRGQSCRLAAFAIRPELRGRGFGRQFMQQLIDEAKARGDRNMWLEVIVGNDSGLALYERMGFVRQNTFVGFYATSPARFIATNELTEVDPLMVAKKMMADTHLRLPWLSGGETLFKLPGQAFSLQDAAYAMVVTAPYLRLRMLYVDPAARGKGLAKKLLMLLRERFPGIATAAAIPEQMSPLFLSCGYRQDPITQYEMLLKL
ncbi:GNAT family acetyltransferase [Buttiauxella ferragutiae ATCC 51602]|jgi:ribosomal protein S18 acetylase RimI-like enzyme|uniref:GNAT family acetyltransferase n=1 Tax=Buttiauxella ferragutiae ATCC 51602 TaxID=1354252 RepID=A0ABX2W216_9ENTR|nr:GNAT family N-acetyltransferase [Buttiauxella ferragutiae]OAT24521.1 GNAT family acetyltransferase [Buttiauxella ferragutiae ATCC 51602]